MEKMIYLASCPVCGRALFKGSPNSYVEGGCPKCKNYVQVTYTNDGFKANIRTPIETHNAASAIQVNK